MVNGNFFSNSIVSCLQTSLFCVGAGIFRCPLVVTMRPIPSALLDAAVNVTHLNPLAHGAPVHIGDPGLSRSSLLLPVSLSYTQTDTKQTCLY